jgi:hypothetical protein
MVEQAEWHPLELLAVHQFMEWFLPLEAAVDLVQQHLLL